MLKILNLFTRALEIILFQDLFFLLFAFLGISLVFIFPLLEELPQEEATENSRQQRRRSSDDDESVAVVERKIACQEVREFYSSDDHADED